MKVKDLIEKLSKLDPELECFTIDVNGEWNALADVWFESDSTIDHKGIAYFESSWAEYRFVPYEVWRDKEPANTLANESE